MVRIFPILTKEMSELRSGTRGEGISNTGLPEDICSQKPLDDWFLGYSPGSVFLWDIFFTIQQSGFPVIIHIYISHTYTNRQAHNLHYTCTLSCCLWWQATISRTGSLTQTDPLSNRQCWKPPVIVKPHGKKLVFPSYTLNIFEG